MRIVNERPPVWDRVVSLFPYVIGKPVFFAWGSVIYNPSGTSIAREIIKHEEVHAERQGKTDQEIRAWWDRYLTDPGFRLLEEIPAHQAEYRAYCKRHGAGREKYLRAIAERLASPLYGTLLDIEEAAHVIVCSGKQFDVVAGRVVEIS